MTMDLDSLPTQRSIDARTFDVRTVEPLTRRERVILSNLDEVTTPVDTPPRRFGTRNTVKSQARSGYRKRGAPSRADAVACARQIGLR